MAAESKLQAKIINDLTCKGWLVNKIIRCTRSGWVDVEAFRAMEIIMLEIKAPNKQPTALQKYVHQQLKKQGFTVYVVDSWEQYLKLNI